MAKNGDSKNKRRKKLVCVSGYFSPLHIGHIELFRKAKDFGDYLMVVVNNDEQQLLKKGKVFMNEKDRAAIISSLKMVDDVIISIDKDRTICETLKFIEPDFFVNGGDRTSKNIPEKKVCRALGIKMIFGAGKKIRSSSELLNNYIQ